MKKFLLGIAVFITTAILCIVSAGAETYGDYEYNVLSNGTVEITGYTGSATNLTIPSKINGKAVTVIGEMAFHDCNTLTSVTIPYGVTLIDNGAFFKCEELVSVTIPASVKTLDNNCFYWCTSLKSVKIPKGVTTIGKSVFYYCYSLTSVTIPDSVTTIGHGAFNSCSSLTSIVIPDSVTSLGDYAFRYCTSLKSVKLSDKLTIIDENTFYACWSLTSISIPNSIKTIGEYAFCGCNSLKSVVIPANVKSIGEYTFYQCESLTSITVLGSTTSIGKLAFGFDGYDHDTETHIMVDGVVINCYKDSPAYRYAVNNKVNYKLISGPTIVSGFGISVRTSNSLTLSWTKNTSANGYILEQFNGSKWVRIAKITNPAATTYKLTGLKAGTVYKFRMRAYKTFVSQALYSDYTSTLAVRTNPSDVSGLKLGGRTSNALRLNWTKNASADGYIVEQYKNGSWVRIARISGNATTTYRISGLAASTQYKFRVKAYKMSGSTALYSGYTSTLAAYTNPSAVSGLRVRSKSDKAIRLAWKQNTTADGYIIEQYKNGKWTRIARIADNETLSCRIDGLAKATTYKFRVATYNIEDNVAYYGAYVSVSGTTNK
ncbi:MAG: leucine-rich repeat protein [Ruminiclostridium sp.]|nr:leucine-rich repeat protein [Ruminiclostridium sp.]